ncbi:MAG TPA: hypothetical protein VL971_05520 [Rhizomicrobium sp.]|nr:hypothetical protein [Rhizomicrobium sp.]
METSEQEKAAALAAKKQMTAAAVIIVGSFVLVFVAIALVLVIGHIKLF